MRRPLSDLPRNLIVLSLVAVTFAALGPARAGRATPRSDRLERVIVLGPGAASAAARHGTLVSRMPIVGGVSATIPAHELGALASERGVTRVVPDGRMVRNGSAGAVTLATLYPLDDDVQRSWDWGYNGSGVGIAIIDSGVGAGPDFGTRLHQVVLPDQTGSVDDANGHGTLVAGIAAGSSPDGRYKGIAPGASVYAINVARNGNVYSSDVITALDWVLNNAHANNIRVVNLSVSETTPSSYRNSVLDLAVERVWASGTVVVVAAGNTGANPGSVDYAPANDPFVLTVGGMDDKGTAKLSDDDIASFSARGTTMDGYSKPEILATGRLVASVLKPGTVLDSQAPAANRTAPGYAKISGTSFAAPQVAGAAAILFQQHPGWSPDAVKYTLTDRARIVKSGAIVQLDVGATVNIWDPMGLRNQGVPSLVCHPGATCQSGTTISSIWNSSSWTNETWNNGSWTNETWNNGSWTSATWVNETWNNETWNGLGDWSYTTWN
jgi:serine protease AprX